MAGIGMAAMPGRRRMACVASIPLMTGICTSISISDSAPEGLFTHLENMFCILCGQESVQHKAAITIGI